MRIQTIENSGRAIALIDSAEVLIADVQSALDFIMTVQYEAETNRIALNKTAVADAFFVLSSGLAGEVLQKFINYHVKVALYGDYSRYTSKPLRDFIYESNKGNDIFFTATAAEAVEALSRAK